MKSFVLIIILAAGISYTGSSQKIHYLFNFTSDIRADIDKDTSVWKYHTAAIKCSFIGDHKNTLIYWDSAVHSPKYIPTAEDSILLKNAKLKNAKDYIVERSKKEQLIIINEAHHNPMHRRFTASLLKDLYRQGYRCLGLEAIADSMNAGSGTDITEKSHYYTKESEFSNMVYEARKLGFILFTYESGGDKNGKEREMEQARNIQQFMQQHPDEKVIIHCGFDHISEGVSSMGKAMAGYLKEYTGIDPFTIDHVKFSERSSPELSHYFVNATRRKEAFVLIDKKNVSRNISEPQQTDLAVVHPRTRYKWNRPHWRAAGRKTYWMPKKMSRFLSSPLLVIAIRSDELQKSIPADIIQLEHPEDKKPLYLTPGKYTLLLLYDSYEFRARADITVP